jgi:hypothetical protein
MLIRSIILAAVLPVVALVLGACSPPTTQNPHTDQPHAITRPTLDAETEIAADRVVTSASIDAADEAAKVAAAQAAYASVADRVAADADRTLRDAQRTLELTAAEVDRTLSRIEQRTQRDLKQIASRYKSAAADLDAQEKARAMWSDLAGGVLGSPAVQGVASTVPGGSLALGVISTLAAWFGARAVHKAENRGWTERDAEAKAAAAAAELEALRAGVRLKLATPSVGVAGGVGVAS